MEIHDEQVTFRHGINVNESFPRNWSEIDKIYAQTLSEIYAQPEDAGHRQGTHDFILWFVHQISDLHSVIDMGCGEGYAQDYFNDFGIDYLGLTMSDEDVAVAMKYGRNVNKQDFNFLPALGGKYSLCMSRHSLEHSPFPVITLRLWREVANWLAVCLPHPDWYKYGGLNHYSVMDFEQARAMFDNSGWLYKSHEIKSIQGSPDKANYQGQTNTEMWFLLKRSEKLILR